MMTRRIEHACMLSALALMFGMTSAGKQATSPLKPIAPAVTVSTSADLTSLAVIGDAHVAAGLADGRVALWNGRDSTTSDLPAHNTKVLAVGTTADGQRVLSIAGDGSLAESPIAKGAAGRTRRIDLGTAPTRAAMFSLDGSRLLTGGEFGDVRVYDVESGKLRREFPGHRGEIQDLAVRPQSALIASAGADADVRVWNASTGRAAGFIENDVSMFALAFSPKDGTLASGGVDRRVTFRDPGTFARLGVFTLTAPKMVATLAWSPDGRFLAVGDLDDETLSKGGLQIVDASTRAVVAVLDTSDVPALRIVFFAGGTRLAAIMTRELRAWNLNLAP
jgi:WD40 repeat protein